MLRKLWATGSLTLSLLLTSKVQAQTVNLTWDPPTHKVAPPGQTPAPLTINELKEFRLYNQRKLYKVVAAPTVEASVSMVGSRNYAWEVTAVDKSGAESGYSNVLIFQPTPVPTLQWPPSEPSGLKQK